MKPPTIVIIDDESAARELVKHALLTHPVRPDVSMFSSPKEYFSFLSENKAPTAILCDYKLGETTGVEFAQQFYERGYRAPVFLITGMENIRDYAFNAMREGYINERLILKSEINDRQKFMKTLDEIISGELFVQPQALGIIGLGKLGMGGIVSDALKLRVHGVPCLEHLYIYSKFLLSKNKKAHRESIPDLVGLYNSKRVTLVDTPDEVFKRVQIAVIATGAHGLSPSQFETREDIEKIMFQESVPKMVEIYQSMARTNYNHLKVIFTSPPEPHLYMGTHILHNSAATFMCPTADESRQAAAFYEIERPLIEKELKICLDIDSIKLISVGWHGRERIVVEKTKIQKGKEWRLLGDLIPRYYNPAYARKVDDAVAARANSQGLRSEKASEIWGLPPHDTPTAFTKLFRAIACCQSKTPESVLCYSEGSEIGLEEKIRGYFLRPANIERQSSHIVPDMERFTVADAPEYIQEIFRESLIEQRISGHSRYIETCLKVAEK